MKNAVLIICGDALEQLSLLPVDYIQCCVTSPPYWGLRDYGVAGQMGLEATPGEYVEKMVAVFREVRRVLKDDGTCWINLGDSYATGGGNGAHGGGYRGGHDKSPKAVVAPPLTQPNRQPIAGLKPKDLVGIPWRVAFALQADGWYLRQDIIWAKPNPMPESVTDRCTKSHEYLFLLSKSARYYFDGDAIKEPSVTDDIRRPYGSEGAWALDGRPDDQKHGGEPRSWKGSEFQTGKTGEHQLGRSQKVRKPAGWDTGAGSHGTIHRDGRALEVEYQEIDGSTRNKRDVWTVPTAPFKDAHFATFPPDLIRPCILAGSKPGDTILDPFFGSGTVGMVSLEYGRNCLGIELNPKYAEMAKNRCNITPGLCLA